MSDLSQRLRNAVYRLDYRVAFPLAKIWWRYHRTDCVVVAVWMNKRLLVVKHSYKHGFGFPGGSITRGADHRAAAAQKLREEVGLNVDPAQLQLVCMLPPTAGYCGYADLFEVRVQGGTALSVDNRRITDAGFLLPCDITDFDCQPIVTYYLRQSHREAEIRLLTETEQTST